MSRLRRAMFAAQFPVGDGDPYWGNVGALLHFDGDLTDETGFVWGQLVSPTFEAGMFSQSLRGHASQATLEGGNNTIADDQSTPFTVEAFVKIYSGGVRIVSQSRRAGNGDQALQISATRVLWQDLPSSSSTMVDVDTPTDTWVHVAFTYDGTTRRAFINGNAVFEEINHGWRPNQYGVRVLGAHNGSFGQTGADGSLDELRITKGVARYTEDFTPPTKPFPNYEGWLPSKFFAGGANGLWYRFADISTLYQDTSMTVHVTADNDPVGGILDKSGNNVNGLQAVSGERVSFKTSPNRINFDKVDDNIDINFGAAFSGTVYINTDVGLLSYEINVPSGVWQLPVDARYLHSNGFREIIAVARAANESDYNLVRQYMGAGVFAPIGTLFTWFANRSEIVSFFDYSLDTSGGTNFSYAWSGCSGLASFPLLDVSGGTTFLNGWRLCSNLVNFPANFFDNCLATNFSRAFESTNLSQESIDGILVSINSNGTSNGTFNQSGGNAPSAVGQAAILAMRARGWTVTVTGGF